MGKSIAQGGACAVRYLKIMDDYRFSKDFPEIKKHAEEYEAEIAKLIANLGTNADMAFVEYRDV